MTNPNEMTRLTCSPRGIMPSSEAVENIKVYQSTCFASPTSKEGNSAPLDCKGKGGGKGLQQEEGVLFGGDCPDATCVVREVGVNGPENGSALEVDVELADERCRLCGWQAVLLKEREVSSALPKTNSMSGSIYDILDFNDGMSFLWWGGFLAVYVQ